MPLLTREAKSEANDLSAKLSVCSLSITQLNSRLNPRLNYILTPAGPMQARQEAQARAQVGITMKPHVKLN